MTCQSPALRWVKRRVFRRMMGTAILRLAMTLALALLPIWVLAKPPSEWPSGGKTRGRSSAGYEVRERSDQAREALGRGGDSWRDVDNRLRQQRTRRERVREDLLNRVEPDGQRGGQYIRDRYYQSWRHPIVDHCGDRYDSWYYWGVPPVIVYNDDYDGAARRSTARYEVVAREGLEWVEGYFDQVAVREVIDGEYVDVYYPAVYEKDDEGKRVLVEQARTVREPKVRIILTKVWVEGHYVEQGGGEKAAPLPNPEP